MSRQRDRSYIIKDIILKLVEYGELNQTALICFCGLNLKKHRYLLYELEINGLIDKNQLLNLQKKVVAIYKPTQRGIEFCRDILEPYEEMFPRTKKIFNNNNNEEMPTTKVKVTSEKRVITTKAQH